MPPSHAERMRKLGKAGFKATFGTAAFTLLAAIVIAEFGYPGTWPVKVCVLGWIISLVFAFGFGMIWHEGYRLTQK